MAKKDKKKDPVMPDMPSSGADEPTFIQIISKEDAEAMGDTKVPATLPILPLRNNVLFPGEIIPITIGRRKSIDLINAANDNHTYFGTCAQKSRDEEDPTEKDLYTVGTMARVIRILKMPDGSLSALIQGIRRIKTVGYKKNSHYLQAKVEAFDTRESSSKDLKAALEMVRESFMSFARLIPHVKQEAMFTLQNIDSPDILLAFVADTINLSTPEKQVLLEKADLVERASALIKYINTKHQNLEWKRQIEGKVEADIAKQQKEYFLTQQLKTIQDELGGSAEQELKDLVEAGKNKKWKDEVREHFEKEVAKTRHMSSMSQEYSVQLNYLSTLVGLPWDEYTADNYDAQKARKILDKDHFGLEKVKERILSHMAVLKLRGDMKAPILCLVGPPGVGKTSLGKSIAAAMGRKYVRMSLGGLHDEAEVRGHRKTYVGAMPGRVIQGIKKAKSSNPVFMLDEVDKLAGMTHNGDPSAALLELLDPEQNVAFHDNFIEVDYDLSKVLFIATANTLSTIHPALLDRMEIIEVPSYVMDEKVKIAQKHLIPKQLEEHGMKPSDMAFPEDMIRFLIAEYTREAGVRRLEKQIAALIRERAKHLVSENARERRLGAKVSKAFIKEALGVPSFTEPEKLKADTVGVSTGLAWTSVGGDVLFIEAATAPGKGELHITGNLGTVMQESASVAMAYIKSNAKALGIDAKKLKETDIHIHVPEGATPKDGPSAGITLFTAMVSALKGVKVKCSVAMTGEMTLRGQVLPIGGVREKLLAAKRAGIGQIILCRENRPQVEEIPELYTKGLDITYVDKAAEVLKAALC
ncbi:MAG: endopeptidase La [Bacteroides sp.]|nr:endopeptidase La [Ruminococcus flavefaciens]MCM1555558.1 endopeptidase La [Bacteroides sp.]